MKLKTSKIKGTDYPEVYKKAYNFYKIIKKNCNKRRPHVRSKYFMNQKVFLELFWVHLHQKNTGERQRRVAFLPAAVEFILNSVDKPSMVALSSKSSEIFYRFRAEASNGEVFFIQIKEHKKSGQKWLMSIFPEK